MENVVAEEASDEHGRLVNIEDQFNDDMEDDDHADNIVDDDGKNTLIHDTFNNVRMDDDDGHEIDDFDDVHDIPLLEKAHEPLYEGSNITLLFVVMLIMNLKVTNGFSNTLITQMLRYVLCLIIDIYTIMINVIFVSLIFQLLVNKDEIFVINSLDIFILTIFFNLL